MILYGTMVSMYHIYEHYRIALGSKNGIECSNMMGFGPQLPPPLPLGKLPESPHASSFQPWLRGYDILEFVSRASKSTRGFADV